MTPQQRLKDVAMSEGGFVFDTHTGLTFTVNTAGRFVLEALRQGLAEREILAMLMERFDVEQSIDLGRDCEEFLAMLRDLGILPRPEAR